jgi:hypothetical protein
MTAMGMERAAAYIANINEASFGTEPGGSIDFGLTSPAIENPAATRTFIAVTAEAMRIGAGREARGVIESVSSVSGATAGYRAG